MQGTKLNAIMIDECCGKCRYCRWIRSVVGCEFDEYRCSRGCRPIRGGWGYECEHHEADND